MKRTLSLGQSIFIFVQYLVVDMAKRAGRVRFGSDQSGYGSRVKMGHFKWVENGFGSIGLRVGSG